MLERQPYTYVILRYRHDPLAGEMVNVGVLLHASAKGFLAARTRKTSNRLSKLYPDLEAAVLTAEMRRIETAADQLAIREHKAAGDLDLMPMTSSAATLGRRIVDDPAGTLLWGDEGAGITANPEETLAQLFERFVSRFDKELGQKRSDADVWKAVREAFASRQVSSRLEEKTIRSDKDEVTFEHAWKNGVWHVFQPLSFDLADADAVRNKAARWVGHIVGLSQSKEDFQPYFIVGKPAEAYLQESFERAVSFLAEAPGGKRPRIVREAEAGQLAEEIGQEIERHEAGT